jgi:hypothetical protein
MNTAAILLLSTALTTAAGPTLAPADESAPLTPTPASTTLSRQEIRQMPITQRPSRPGHFYGNTVRRAHQRRTTR